MSASIIALIATFAGGLIGAGGSLATQRLSLHATAQQREAERQANLRDERKATLVEFLDAVQLVERLVDRRWRTGNIPEEAGDAIHRLWLQQKILEIIGGHDLRVASLGFSLRLSDGLFEQQKRDYSKLGKFLEEDRNKLLQAARRELDIPDRD